MIQRTTLSFRDFIRSFEKLGFRKIRQKGSHIRFAHPDGRKLTIPDHGNKDVPRGLFVKIIHHDLEMKADDFLKDD